MLSGARLRVERKETVEPGARRDLAVMSGGSPRNRYLADNEAMALMFQRGLSIGMANAASSPVQAIPPPSFTPYPYYQPMNPQATYNPYADPNLGVNNDTPANVQIHGNTYVPHTITGQFQYSQGVHPYALVQFPTRQNTYQWPPNNTNGEMNIGSSGAIGEESH